MAKLFGVDYGKEMSCRVCQANRFLVEQGRGKVTEGEKETDISVLIIRCARCGTVLDQFQVNWDPVEKENTKVAVADGIAR